MLGGDVLHEVELVMVMRIDATIVTLPRRSRLESISFFHEISRVSARAIRVEVEYNVHVACRGASHRIRYLPCPEQSRVRVWGGLFDKT
jgi:hypothetical protein